MEQGLVRHETGAIRTTRADSDAQLVALWLRGKRSPHTQRAYAREAERFLAFVGQPLRSVTLEDALDFADSLRELAPASQARALSAIKALLAFGHVTGYLPVNVGAAVLLPALENTLAERILSESEVQRILALEEQPRNRALLRLLYATGGRVSEVTGLQWRHVLARGESGQVTVFGKGGKTRAVLLSRDTWRELVALRPKDADPEGAVFESRKGGSLDPASVWRIVRAAAVRAGLSAAVSPHWFRHAHASHALDRGAPAHLVKETLGHASLTTTSRYAHARPGESSSKYLAV